MLSEPRNMMLGEILTDKRVESIHRGWRHLQIRMLRHAQEVHEPLLAVVDRYRLVLWHIFAQELLRINLVS